MARVYDVVVAGAGHNSLTAAAYLAKAGMKILVLERNGHNLLIHGKIIGSLPMKAVIRPDEARKGIGLIGLKTFLFLLTFLFRGNGKQAGQLPTIKMTERD